MKRYTRQEMMRETGATPEEMADLERRGLLIPSRRYRLLGLFGPREEYFMPGQLEVLRLLLKERRLVYSLRSS